MEHLAVDVPDEEVLRGTVQYRWMYPIERRLRLSKEREDIRRHFDKFFVEIKVPANFVPPIKRPDGLRSKDHISKLEFLALIFGPDRSITKASACISNGVCHSADVPSVETDTAGGCPDEPTLDCV